MFLIITGCDMRSLEKKKLCQLKDCGTCGVKIDPPSASKNYRKLPAEFSVKTASVWPPIGCIEKVCRRGTEAGFFSRPSVTASSLFKVNETCRVGFSNQRSNQMSPKRDKNWLFIDQNRYHTWSLFLLLTSVFPWMPFLEGWTKEIN